MSYAPWIPKNHLEVLEGHPDRYNTSLPRMLYYPVMVVGYFLGASLLHNKIKGRPIKSGIQRHIAVTIAGAWVGHGLAKLREYNHQETEARTRHYIETHRDHFPDYEMVKVGDILEPWIPNR